MTLPREATAGKTGQATASTHAGTHLATQAGTLAGTRAGRDGETPRWNRLGPATAARLEEAAVGILERNGVETGSDCLDVLDLRVEAHGVDGSYLETDHTFAHYRERWYPTLVDRRGYEAWRAGGATTLAQRAAGRLEELLASHAPTPLDPDVEGAVRAVVERVQAAAGL